MQAENDTGRYFRFATEQGSVVIESSDSAPGAGPVAQRGVIEDTGKRLEAALSHLTEILGPLQKQVREQLADAEEITVEFGIKVTAEAGLIVAKTELEGNFKVSVLWKK